MSDPKASDQLRPHAVLETVLYATNLEDCEAFYRRVLGLAPFQSVPGRHRFYKLEHQVLLIFNPDVTREPPKPGALPVPPHGATGDGHVCFACAAGDLDDWRQKLGREGVAIEADFEWPQGGRSIYFRDPAGNCLELAEPRIWGLN
jgi:catechol 2,3-dioxygenase-like lactoylglutathione lyase family enzyme